MERRQSTRIPFKAPALVLLDGESVSSEVQNISKQGIFISTRGHHVKGDTTLISIRLQDGKTSLSVTLPCAVARVSDSGIGCRSPHLEPEALLFISNLIHSEKVAPSEFVRSFYNYMDALEFSV
jgi:hypothetical protein